MYKAEFLNIYITNIYKYLCTVFNEPRGTETTGGGEVL